MAKYKFSPYGIIASHFKPDYVSYFYRKRRRKIKFGLKKNE